MILRIFPRFLRHKINLTDHFALLNEWHADGTAESELQANLIHGKSFLGFQIRADIRLAGSNRLAERVVAREGARLRAGNRVRFGMNITAVQADVSRLSDLDRLYETVKKQKRR